MREPEYKVVWPLGKSVYRILPSSPNLTDLTGKTICVLWDWVFRGDEVLPLINELLLKRYSSIKFVDYATFGNIHGPREAEVIAALPALLQKHGCDAVISGVGA